MLFSQTKTLTDITRWEQACFVTVYGPVPKTLSARRKDIGLCGVCRAPMRLTDEDDMPKGGSRVGGTDSESSSTVRPEVF